MLLDLLSQRYSCRDFSDKKIPNDIIKYIVECGRLSPSGGNEQPWKFGVITDVELIEKLSKAASLNYNQDWIAKAPLIIILCTQLFEGMDDTVGLNRYPSMSEKIKAMDNDLYVVVNMEEHQTKIPGEHMVLAALEHGIYSTWISSVNCEEVGKIIGINGYLVTNLIAFGYPATDRDLTLKKELGNITFTNYFCNTGLTLLNV